MDIEFIKKVIVVFIAVVLLMYVYDYLFVPNEYIPLVDKDSF